jgi:hypothetical protein
LGIIGDAIATLVPAVGTAGPGYATTINALLEEFKTRLVAKVGFTSLNAGAAPASTAALTVSAAGALDTNDATNIIGTLYATNAEITNPIKHGVKVRNRAAHLGGIVSGTPVYFSSGKGVGSSGGACTYNSDLPDMETGEVISAVTVKYFRGVGAGTAQIKLYRRANTPVQVGSTASSTATPGGVLELTVGGLSETVVDGASYFVEVVVPVSQDVHETTRVSYSRPT